VAKPRLHLDADASIKALVNELLRHGHDVTRTPNEWMATDASDKEQLLGATARGRIILTFNIRDFLKLSKNYPHHAGILLAVQSRWSLVDLMESIERALSETTAEDWHGRVRWLNDFRSR
jgi:hypothetical protein